MTAWNPDVATQLCLASEDDQAPIIQVYSYVLGLAFSRNLKIEKSFSGIMTNNFHHNALFYLFYFPFNLNCC